MLNLEVEKTVYTDKNGNQKEYSNLYVTVLGVKVQLKPADRTGQLLITNYLDSKK